MEEKWKHPNGKSWETNGRQIQKDWETNGKQGEKPRQLQDKCSSSQKKFWKTNGKQLVKSERQVEICLELSQMEENEREWDKWETRNRFRIWKTSG